MTRNNGKTELLTIRVTPETAKMFREFALACDFKQGYALRKLLEAAKEIEGEC